MLTKEQIEFYKDQGYLVVENVFTESECEEMRREIDAMVFRANNVGRKLEATWRGAWRETLLHDKDAKNSSVLSIHNVQYHAAIFTKVLVNEQMTGILADLIGPNVQLHHTKMHLKPPEIGSPFPMHQDYPYFPHEKHTMTACVIHVDEATVENGCLCVYPGSHKLGDVGHAPDGLYLPPEEYPLEKATPAPGKAGSILVFSYFMIHGSYVNKTDQTRRIVLYQFRAADDRPTEQRHLSPGQGTMVLGFNPDFEAMIK